MQRKMKTRYVWEDESEVEIITEDQQGDVAKTDESATVKDTEGQEKETT